MPVPGSKGGRDGPKMGQGTPGDSPQNQKPRLAAGPIVARSGRTNKPTSKLKLSADQLATEHSSDTHKSCSEQTQGSRFRHGEVRGTRVDVPDTLAELFAVHDIDGLLCGSGSR